MHTRRTLLQLLTLSAASRAATSLALPSGLHDLPALWRDLPAKLAALETGSGGRLGVAVLDTASGQMAGHRTGERFAMCSTFKAMLAAAVLRRVDRGEDRLDRPTAIPPKPLVSHSPFTEVHAGDTMTVAALCHAALTQSDNTAANLLLANIAETGGLPAGPAAFTRFARSLGDTVTRLDRTETTLNEAAPGDARDTTSPAAMAASLQRILLGDVLSAGSRAQLKAWMIENQYGADRLRAGLPPDWGAADKTGANGETTTNDIAVYWPPRRAPLVVTAYLTECPGPEAKRAAVLAGVASLVVAAVQLLS